VGGRGWNGVLYINAAVPFCFYVSCVLVIQPAHSPHCAHPVTCVTARRRQNNKQKAKKKAKVMYLSKGGAHKRTYSQTSCHHGVVMQTRRPHAAASEEAVVTQDRRREHATCTNASCFFVCVGNPALFSLVVVPRLRESLLESTAGDHLGTAGLFFVLCVHLHFVCPLLSSFACLLFFPSDHPPPSPSTFVLCGGMPISFFFFLVLRYWCSALICCRIRHTFSQTNTYTPKRLSSMLYALSRRFCMTHTVPCASTQSHRYTPRAK
jgi:hypothetical protein